MKIKSTVMIASRITSLAGALLLSCAFGSALDAAPQPEQKGFDTPELAVEELIKATESFDVPALTSILGPGSEDLVASEDAVQDKSRAATFAAKAKEKNATEVDPKNKDRATLFVGNEEWPLPIPIVKRKAK